MTSAPARWPVRQPDVNWRSVEGRIALVPRSRLHLIRFHGVLAPNAGLRAAVVPGPPEKPGEPAGEHAHGVRARMGWARLLKRVFELDLQHCPQCGAT